MKSSQPIASHEKLVDQGFVYCVVSSGFNDSLNQIQLCWDYCDRTGRQLVVDAAYEGVVRAALGMLEPRQKQERVVFLPAEDFLQMLNGLGAYPSCLSGRVEKARDAVFNPEVGLVDDGSGQYIGFDFGQRYSEQVLVHHQWGGGRRGEKLLTKLRLKSEWAKKITLAPGLSPGEYDFFHVRSTDYKVDEDWILEKMAKRQKKRKIQLATDSDYFFTLADEAFGGDRVYGWRPPKQKSNLAVHSREFAFGGNEAEKEALRLFSELLGAALSRRFFYTFVGGRAAHDTRVLISGMSVLMRFCRRNSNQVRALFRRELPGGPLAALGSTRLIASKQNWVTFLLSSHVTEKVKSLRNRVFALHRYPRDGRMRKN